MPKKKKTRYLRNGIVFDPNIEEDIFDMGYEESQKNKKIYRKGKKKREVWKGL
jgi:hypothetical protein